MFKNEFQGGPYFEIFSAQGKDPASNWKLNGGSGVRKVYDKDVKSYVYTLEGSSTTTKMQLPKDSRTSLTLVQRFLIIQIFVPKGQDVSIELGVTDLGNNKRRLLFSSAAKEIGITPLHAKIPLTVLRRAIWLNLCMDMASLVGDSWKGQTYRAIESVTVSANCRIRRVFTMKVQPTDTTDDDALYNLNSTNSGELDSIPKQCQIAIDVPQLNQVLTMTKLRQAELKAKGIDISARVSSATEIDLNSSGRKSNANDSFHIAFGSKVAVPPPLTAQRKLTSGKEGNRTSRSSHSSAKNEEGMYSASSTRDHHKPDTLVVDHLSSGRIRMPSDPGAAIEDAETSIDKSTLGGSHTWSTPIDKNDETPFKPHPPREPSGDRRVRRKIRIKSGGKERTPHSGTADKQETSPVPSPRKHISNSDMMSDEKSPRQDTGTGPESSDSAQSFFENSQERNKLSSGKNKIILKPIGSDTSQVSGRDFRKGQPISNPGNMHNSMEGPNKQTSDKKHHHRHVGPGGDWNQDYHKGSRQHKEENPDESIIDVIQVLQDRDNIHDRQYQGDKDEDDLREHWPENEDVYIFKSPPKRVPRRNHSPNTNEQENKTKKSSVKGQQRKGRSELAALRGPQHEDDFAHSASSDEEDLRKKILRNSPSPRPPSTPRSTDSSPANSNSSRGLRKIRNYKQSNYQNVETLYSPRKSPLENSQSGINLKDSGVGPSLSVKNHIPSVKESDSEPTVSVSKDRLSNSNSDRTNSKSENKSSDSDRSRGSRETPLRIVGLGQLRGPRDNDMLAVSMNSTASRMSISRKSVREIPKDDARLSQSLKKPYEFAKYQMQDDLSESFEANMLLSLKRQQDNDDDGDVPNDNNDDAKKGNGLEQHVYGNDSVSSGSDDTSFSTWRGPAPTLLAHHYQDEMHLPTSRLSHDPLSSSNPRDWTGVFSPPIVLPSDMNKTRQQLAADINMIKSPRKHSPDPKPRGRLPSKSHGDGQGNDTDSEEELDLLYDPCLNCYFDPKTCKYYELV